MMSRNDDDYSRRRGRRKRGSLTTELCQKVDQEKEGNLQPSASTNDIKCKQKYYVTEFIENDA